ncbi:MAG: hypothetical protein ACRDIF_00690 [Actinomycetota bacterium]
MIIDCGECEAYQSSHCKDCFVMAVLSFQGESLWMGAEEQEAISHLCEAGLAPALKFRRRLKAAPGGTG